MQWVPPTKRSPRQRLECRLSDPNPARICIGTKGRVRWRLARFALAAAVAGVMGGTSRGNNVTWTGLSSGSWTDFSWSSSPDLPGTGDDVTIDVSGAEIVVTLKQDKPPLTGIQVIRSLISNEAFTIESGGLSVAADSTVNGAFTLSGGLLSGAGNFTLNGPSTWINQSTMDGTGKTIVSATGSLTIQPGTFNKILARSLDNFGTMTLMGDSIYASIEMRSSTIDNKPGALFTVNNTSDAFFYGATGTNSFLNNGTFTKTGTAAATFGGAGSNPVPFVNSGQVNVQAGTLILQTGATHTGHFAITSGALLQFEGGHTFSATSDITGAGNVIFNSVGTNVSDGVFDLSGAATFAGATNTFNGVFAAGSLLVPNGATFTFNNTTTLGTLTATNLLLSGSGDVRISGTSTWTGFGTMSGSGKTIITAGSLFTFDPAAAPKNLQRTFVNNGAVNWGGTGVLATLNLTGALFDNKAGASFNALGDQYSFFGVSGANTFNNAGTFSKSGTGTASFTGNGTSIVSLMNSGTVLVSAGLLQLDSSFTNSGTVSISGGTITLGAGLVNTGAIALTGGVLNLNGTITTAQLGNWSNAGGQVNLLGTLDNTSSTLGLNDTTGNLRLQAGSKIIGGALSTGGTSRVTVVGAAMLDGVTLSGPINIFQASNLTVLNGLTLGGQPLTLNAAGNSLVTFQGSQSIGGTGVLTTTGGPGVATLGISSGATLTVGAGITVHPGTRDIILGSSGGSVVNQGLFLEDAAGYTLTVSGTSIQNDGTFQIQNGGTIFVNGALGNISSGTLAGGTWQIASGGTLRLLSGGITTNATMLVLDGAAANILTGASGTNDALANLVENAATGDLSILNGKTLSIAGDFLNNGKLTLGAGSGLAVAGLFTHNGTMTTSGTISTGKTIVDGSFTLAGGTHTVSADFVLGSAKNAAKYDLNSGTLTVGGFGTVGAGPSGAAIFNQAGGTFTVAKQLFVSTSGTNTSTYNLSGGSLSAGEILVGFFGGSQGVFNQTGGTVTLTANPAVSASGGLTLGFSSLPNTSGTYNLSSGSLSDQGVQIGFAGPGNFNQTGGTHTVNGALNLGMFTGGTGTYSMSNGANLNVTLDEIVGTYANGVFNQSGGVNTVGGIVKIGPNSGASGIFNFSDGTVNASLVDLSRGTFNQTGGTLNVLNFAQEGGEVTGTLQGQGTFTYTGGTFSGRLVNTGTVALYADFTAGNGLENRNLFDVAANRKVTLNGAGFSGNGTTTLSGTLTASIEKIGESVNGTFTLSAGANNVAGDFDLGFGAGITGTYTLQGGNLAVAGISNIGVDGTGILNLAGGAMSAGTVNLVRGGLNLTGGTLAYTSLVQSGGDISGTLTNLTSYTFNGGTFTGRLINSGTAAVNADMTFGNGLDNRGDFSVTGNHAVSLNGTELTSDGSFTLAGSLSSANIKIGVNADGNFTQTSGTNTATGTLYVGFAGHAGTYALQSGSLNVGGNTYVGFDGNGVFNQSNGTHATSNLVLANSAGTTGNYSLGNTANLTVTGNETIGLNGTGTFNQTGGTHTTSGIVTLGLNSGSSGTYNLSGGTFTAGSIKLMRGALNLTGGTLNYASLDQSGGDISGTLSNATTYTFNAGTFTGRLINSGTVVLNADLALGNGLDNRTNFSVAANRVVTLNGLGLTSDGAFALAGSLASTSAKIGVNADGALTQTSGTNAVTGNLEVGSGAGHAGTYTLQAGSLNVGGNEIIGLDGTGTFNQSGGTHTVVGSLSLGVNAGASGIYNLSAGTLTAGSMNLVRGALNDTGGSLNYASFTQTGGDVSGTLSNTSNYTFNGGTFTGRLVNSGTAIVNADVTFANGLDNKGNFTVAGNHAVSLNATDLTSDGAFSLAGSLSSASLKIGSAADGTFTQTSGTNSISGDLRVGFGAGHLGTYALQGGSLNVGGNSYVGFDGSGTFNQTLGSHATHALFIAANAGSTGTYTLAGGNLTATSTTNNGTYTQTGGTASLGNVTGTGLISVSSGTVAAKSIHQNSLSVSANAIVTLATNSGASVVKTLTLTGGAGSTAAIDLGNNALIVDYSATSPVSDIRAAVISGYAAADGPHWTGPGIRSSVAAADSSLGLAVAEASNILHISGTQTATFTGETVDATSVLVRLTKLGDTNLDGRVTFTDFQRLEAGFGQPGATWRTGDFNYDGVVDRADFALLYANYGTSLNGPPVPASAAELQGLSAFAADVPEPSAAVAILFAGAGVMLRRTRRRA